MLFLFGLNFRAVAIKFRSKQSLRWWRQTWDISLSISSKLSSCIAGLALAKIIWGIPCITTQTTLFALQQ